MSGAGALSRVQKKELPQIISGLAEVRRAARWSLSKGSTAAGGLWQAKLRWNTLPAAKAEGPLLTHSCRWPKAFTAQHSPGRCVLFNSDRLEVGQGEHLHFFFVDLKKNHG